MPLLPSIVNCYNIAVKLRVTLDDFDQAVVHKFEQLAQVKTMVKIAIFADLNKKVLLLVL